MVGFFGRYFQLFSNIHTLSLSSVASFRSQEENVRVSLRLANINIDVCHHFSNLVCSFVLCDCFFLKERKKWTIIHLWHSWLRGTHIKLLTDIGSVRLRLCTHLHLLLKWNIHMFNEIAVLFLIHRLLNWILIMDICRKPCAQIAVLLFGVSVHKSAKWIRIRWE